MFSKHLTAAALAASVAAMPASRAAADAGDFVAGALIGGIVGHAVTKNNQKKKQRVYRPGIPSTHEGRQIQSSLNYFGFNAGRVDGQLGRQSRSAIASYQAYMGYPATGQLSAFEQDLLITSYNRAQAGGYQTTQLIASNPEGTRGLLKTYRAEMAGQAVPQQQQPPVVAVAPQPAPVTTVVTPAPAPVAPAPAPVTAVAAVPTTEAATTALPNFFEGGAPEASLASHCNTVSLLTSTNGYTTVASMTDPTAALNEQFCLARTYAIARSEELISQVNGLTPQQVAAQCDGFGPVVQPYVAGLSQKSRDALNEEVSSFVASIGTTPQQLAGTAKICLGVGYRTDNMNVALGSGLILYALGETVYGELMGHHLALGFGTQKNAKMAGPWYEAGLAATDAGADAVFVPGQPERADILRKASMEVTGTPAQAGVLPVFSVTE
ncbi:peptidoglycan-binding domain-containing protein [Roseobacter sinensis]|uniref:Peptidoglycan-binding protein n=1 Tax=Roseobacter sinensis TaxID=2931391 RepID=A0ABT3BGI8_9RHOB|nr:peptidoglycan-binding domain-containing protein [Roseobacter sp. WL0113]MCV3272697.1 peptidoglycan-binding protein [Roseobacter sp. WL0113]